MLTARSHAWYVTVGVCANRTDDLQHGGVRFVGSIQLHPGVAAAAFHHTRLQGHANQRADLWCSLNPPDAGSDHLRLAVVATDLRLWTGQPCVTDKPV